MNRYLSMNQSALRRRCEERLRELDLPVPFDAPAFCAAIAARRGRPLVLEAITTKTGPFGLWVATVDKDYIFYERETSPWHQEHIVLHEACHLLCGHNPTQVDAAQFAQLMLPDLAPDMVRRVLMRSAYPREEEREAELLASLILRRTEGARAARTALQRQDPHDPVSRLEAILDHRDGTTHG